MTLKPKYLIFDCNYRIMEAIRRIITLKDRTLKIELPEQYRDKTVELIILPAQEGIGMVEESKTSYRKLYGSLKSNLTIEQIDEQLKSLREEWTRDIS